MCLGKAIRGWQFNGKQLGNWLTNDGRFWNFFAQPENMATATTNFLSAQRFIEWAPFAAFGTCKRRHESNALKEIWIRWLNKTDIIITGDRRFLALKTQFALSRHLVWRPGCCQSQLCEQEPRFPKINQHLNWAILVCILCTHLPLLSTHYGLDIAANGRLNNRACGHCETKSA